MRVQTKFLLVFAGYLSLLSICGVTLVEYNRGVREEVAAASVRSAQHITQLALDYHSAPYYRYLMYLSVFGDFDRLLATEPGGSEESEILAAVDCYDVDAICVFDGAFERKRCYARAGAVLPEEDSISTSMSEQVFADKNVQRFFMWHGGQLFDVCVFAVRKSKAAPDGYLAVVRQWTHLRLLQMDHAAAHNITFHVQKAGDPAPLASQSILVRRDLNDGLGCLVAHLYAEYDSPLTGLNGLLEKEALLQIVLPGSFAALLILCLLQWVILPLRSLEGALASGDDRCVKGLLGRKSEFGKIAILIRSFFEQNKELEVARDAAMFANQAKSGFLAVMSHEIRTPMTSLMGMMGLLRQGELSDEQDKLIGIMDRSCESLLAIINDILDFSRIEAGKLQLNPEDFNLYQLAEDLEQSALQLKGNRPIDIDLFIDPEVPRWLTGDDVRIRQVLLNLIGNAVKFTDSGHVQISILLKESSAETCSLLLLVADTGVGIAPEQLSHIFQTYTQASTPESIVSGSGLGLAICQKLVDLMGGTVKVESTPGEGSVFTVELELPVARPGSRTLAHRPPSDVSLGLSVLIVEDQSLNAQVLQRLLCQIGCEGDIAENGATALEKLRKRNYDVIFMDCHMPMMDGYECTRNIRKMEEGTSIHTPIIAVTADAMPRTRKQCLDAGMDDYLVKPVLWDGLREALSKYAR